MTRRCLEIEPGVFRECPKQTLPLTKTQERLWRFIASCERSPSYDEMAAHMGICSRGRISLLVRQLKERGYATFIPNRARTIVATKPETNLAGIPTSVLAAELARRLAQ